MPKLPVVSSAEAIRALKEEWGQFFTLQNWRNRWASKKTLAHPTKKGLAVSDIHFRFTNRPKAVRRNRLYRVPPNGKRATMPDGFIWTHAMDSALVRFRRLIG